MAADLHRRQVAGIDNPDQIPTRDIQEVGRRLRRHYVDSGIMQPREYREEGKRTRLEYSLTEMGQGLALRFIAMTEWGDRWLGDGEVPMALYSRSSGQHLTVALVDEGGRAVRMSDVRSEVRTAKPKRGRSAR